MSQEQIDIPNYGSVNSSTVKPSNEHEHGPSCGHVAVHHQTSDGVSHLAFINQDGSNECFKILPVEQGCCNMKVEKDSPCELGDDLNSFEPGYRSKCVPSAKTNKCCDKELCGRNIKTYTLGPDSLLLPSICTGTWQQLFHSAGCDLSSKTHSIFPRKIAVEKERLASVIKSSFVSTSVKINDMCCAMEGKIARDCLDGMPGIKSVSIIVPLRKVIVKHDPEILSATTIVELVKKQGLDASVLSTEKPRRMAIIPDPAESTVEEVHEEEEEIPGSQMRANVRVLIAVLLLLISLLKFVPELEYLQDVALGSVALCLPPIVQKSVKRLRRGVLDITTLMGLACIGAVALGDYSEAAAVVTLYSLSDWLEAIATTRIRNAVEDLVRLKPKKARIIDKASGKVSEVAAESVQVGELVEVRVGDIFPVDGEIVFGATLADESALTGEPKPVKKIIAAAVFAGTANIGPGLVHVKVATEASESVVSKMLRLVEEATANKSSSEQFVESVARVYTPIIFICSVLLATIPWAFGIVEGKKYAKYALVLLVVGCPCALVISTPITYISGLAEAARKGILVKGGTYLEVLAKIDTICFDKTGTLTKGKFELVHFTVNKKQLVSQPDNCSCENNKQKTKNFSVPVDILRSSKDIFDIVKLVESGSNHPIALALCNALETSLSIKAAEAEFASKESSVVSLHGQPFVASQVHLTELETIKGKGVSAQVFKVFTKQDLVEAESTSECNDQCCAKDEEEDIFDFPQLEESLLLDLGFGSGCSDGCCSGKESSQSEESASEYKIEYKVRMLDTDFGDEDLGLVSKVVGKAVDSKVVVTQLGNQGVVVIVSSCFVPVPLLVSSFAGFGLDVVVEKIKSGRRVFIGNLRLSTELNWQQSSEKCKSHHPDDVDLFNTVAEKEAEGLTSCVFGTSSKAYAAFFVGDEVRAESAAMVRQLKAMKLKVMMLTGDNAHAAEAVCKSLDIDSFKASLLPEEKQLHINSLKGAEGEDSTVGERMPLLPKKKARTQVVAMIGDGINDALSLAAADVSISLGETGTSLAVETADVTLVEDNLLKIVEAIKVGRLSYRKIHENVLFSVLVKIAVMGITFGVPYPSLWLAIISDVGAMLLVTLNSMSILSRKRKDVQSQKQKGSVVISSTA